MQVSLFRIKNEAKRFFKSAKGSHGWDHTERVYSLCLHIGKKEKADLFILQCSALLHDIGRSHEDLSLGQTCHAKQGAILARKTLKKHNLDKESINKIIHCIETHRFRGTKIPISKEAKILFDADKLDSIGAIGIGRAFLFAGEVGAKLHNKNIDINNTKPYTAEDTAYREFIVKLSKIKDRMLTKEGRRMAKERHKFMTEFFSRLDKETDGII
jgi:uncharacterized protein